MEILVCEFLFEMRVVNMLLKLCEENQKKPQEHNQRPNLTSEMETEQEKE